MFGIVTPPKTKRGIAFLLFVTYYFFVCACRGKVHYHSLDSVHSPEDKNDSVALKALRRCWNVFTSWYFPNPLLSNAFVQSILAAFTRPAPIGLSFDRDFIPTPDGGTICLSWAKMEGISLPRDAPVIFMLPGTNGDENSSSYMHLACKHAIQDYNFQVVVYIRRGCNIFYSNGRPQDYADPMKQNGDMAIALDYVKSKHPNSKLCGMGYSLGGNFLSNYLGSRSSNNEDCKLICGASICSPMEITGLSYWIEHRYKLVDWYLRKHKADSLVKNRSVIESDSEMVKRGVNVDRIISAPSFRAQCEFDNLIVWGEPGETLNRYLDRSSSYHRVHKIQVPAFFIAALDDPVSHDLFIPFDRLRANPNCVLVTTKSGGHHAYLDAFLWRQLPYCDYLALEWINECVKLTKI